MILFNNFFIIMLFIFSFILLIKFYNHILMILISLEFVVVSIYYMIYMFSFSFLQSFILFYLLFSICESILGLGLLLMMIHYYNNEKFSLMNINLW